MADNATLIKNFRNLRAGLHRAVEGLSVAEMLAIPKGASNNILWNFGHVIFDGCDMIYRSSGLELPLPNELEPFFCAGDLTCGAGGSASACA